MFRNLSLPSSRSLLAISTRFKINPEKQGNPSLSLDMLVLMVLVILFFSESIFSSITIQTSWFFPSQQQRPAVMFVKVSPPLIDSIDPGRIFMATSIEYSTLISMMDRGSNWVLTSVKDIESWRLLWKALQSHFKDSACIKKYHLKHSVTSKPNSRHTICIDTFFFQILMSVWH